MKNTAGKRIQNSGLHIGLLFRVQETNGGFTGRQSDDEPAERVAAPERGKRSRS